jgi:hypothetical protein
MRSSDARNTSRFGFRMERACSPARSTSLKSVASNRLSTHEEGVLKNKPVSRSLTNTFISGLHHAPSIKVREVRKITTRCCRKTMTTAHPPKCASFSTNQIPSGSGSRPDFCGVPLVTAQKSSPSAWIRPTAGVCERKTNLNEHGCWAADDLQAYRCPKSGQCPLPVGPSAFKRDAIDPRALSIGELGKINP